MSEWGIYRTGAIESQNKHAQCRNYVRRYVEWARCMCNYISCRHYHVAPLFLCGLLTADILRHASSRLRIFSKYFPSVLEVKCFLFATFTRCIPKQKEDRRTALTHTYFMVQSPSWEANWFAASQEIPRILCNQKVHYRTHKRPPPVPIQPNPVNIPTSHLLETHPNIIRPSTPKSPQWCLPSGFPTKTLYAPLSSPVRATCFNFQ